MYKKIAPLCYLTLIGFLVASILYAAREEKKPVDQFHLRQSFGLYVTGFCFYLLFKIFGTELFAADLTSMLVFIPLLILWFLGFKSAMEDKERLLPVVGPFYQKWFAFVAREAE